MPAPHVAGDPGFPAWTNAVDAAIAAKLDTATASSTYGAHITGLDRTGANAVANTALIQAALNAGGIVRIQGTGTIAHTGLTLPDGVVFEGPGVNAAVLHNTNAAGGHGITTAAAIRSGQIKNFRMTGVAGSGDCIRIAADFGGLQLVNLRLSPVGAGVNASAGNGIDLLMENVRVNGGTGSFNLSSGGTVVNTITAVNCYAQGSTGTGWSTSNVFACTLTGCSADGNVNGYVLGGNNNLIGCSAEANTASGFAVFGVGNISFDGCFTYGQTVPFNIDAAATVTFKNVSDSATVGANSLVLTANATGRIYLDSHAFSAAISIAAAATLHRRDLDDARGEFTPTLYGSTTAGAHTYTTQNGFYDVVGGLVFVRVSIRIDTGGRDAAMAGNLRIGGLPSPLLLSARDTDAPAPVNFNYFNLGAGYYSVWAKFISANYFNLMKNGTGVSENFLTVSDIGAGTAVLIDFQGVFMKADATWTNL